MDSRLNIGDLTDELKNAIDYWRRYSGERIRIERTTILNDGYQREIKIGVEGEVTDVIDLPPGFLLTDAVEFQERRTLTSDSVSRDETPQDQIFVSFDEAERIVFLDGE